MRKAPHFLCTFIKGTQSFSREALVEKDILMKKQGKEMRKAPHFFNVYLSFFTCLDTEI